MPKNALWLKRLLPAPRERVFEAWTRPEVMARWFFPGADWSVTATTDLRVGGRYEVRMRDAEGRLHVQFGEYREIVPVSRLVFTWSCPELSVTESIVTIELLAQGNRTELHLTHVLPPDPKTRREHEEGWTGCLASLGRMLSDDTKETHMTSIKDEVRIATTAAKAYEALTRQTGYRGWWNTVAEVAESAGGEAKLKFTKDGMPVNMRFRIDEMTPDERVRWTCIEHDMPSWVGTTLTWAIREAGGAVVVTLDHSGWKDSAPDPVAQGWMHFLRSLKAYLETGTGQPW